MSNELPRRPDPMSCESSIFEAVISEEMAVFTFVSWDAGQWVMGSLVDLDEIECASGVDHPTGRSAIIYIHNVEEKSLLGASVLRVSFLLHHRYPAAIT